MPLAKERTPGPIEVRKLGGRLALLGAGFAMFFVLTRSKPSPSHEAPYQAPAPTGLSPIPGGANPSDLAARTAGEDRKAPRNSEPMLGRVEQVRLWDRKTDAPVPHTWLWVAGPGFRSTLWTDCEGRLRLTPEEFAQVTELGSRVPAIDRALRFAYRTERRIEIELPAHLHVHLPPAETRGVEEAEAVLLAPASGKPGDTVPRSYPLTLAGNWDNGGLYLTSLSRSPAGREEQLRFELESPLSRWLAHTSIPAEDLNRSGPPLQPTVVQASELFIELANDPWPSADYLASLELRALGRAPFPNRPQRRGTDPAARVDSYRFTRSNSLTKLRGLFEGDYELRVQHPAFKPMSMQVHLEPGEDLEVKFAPQPIQQAPTTVEIQVVQPQAPVPQFTCTLEWLHPELDQYLTIAPGRRQASERTSAGIVWKNWHFRHLAPGEHRVIVQGSWNNRNLVGVEPTEWTQITHRPEHLVYSFDNSDLTWLEFEFAMGLLPETTRNVQIQFLQNGEPLAETALRLRFDPFLGDVRGIAFKGNLSRQEERDFFRDFGTTSGLARTTRAVIRRVPNLEYVLPEFVEHAWARGRVFQDVPDGIPLPEWTVHLAP